MHSMRHTFLIQDENIHVEKSSPCATLVAGVSFPGIAPLQQNTVNVPIQAAKPSKMATDSIFSRFSPNRVVTSIGSHRLQHGLKSENS